MQTTGCMLDDSLFSDGSQKRYQRSHHTQMLKAGALDISSEELQSCRRRTDGLCERFIQTLKTIVHNAVVEEGKDC